MKFYQFSFHRILLPAFIIAVATMLLPHLQARQENESKQQERRESKSRKEEKKTRKEGEKKAARLIQDLHSEESSVRENAQRELQGLGLLAEKPLEKALKDSIKKGDLEVERRTQAALTHIYSEVYPHLNGELEEIWERVHVASLVGPRAGGVRGPVYFRGRSYDLTKTGDRVALMRLLRDLWGVDPEGEDYDTQILKGAKSRLDGLSKDGKLPWLLQQRAEEAREAIQSALDNIKEEKKQGKRNR